MYASCVCISLSERCADVYVGTCSALFIMQVRTRPCSVVPHPSIRLSVRCRHRISMLHVVVRSVRSSNAAVSTKKTQLSSLPATVATLVTLGFVFRSCQRRVYLWCFSLLFPLLSWVRNPIAWLSHHTKLMKTSLKLFQPPCSNRTAEFCCSVSRGVCVVTLCVGCCGETQT
jgi:hypothetical protein